MPGQTNRRPLVFFFIAVGLLGLAGAIFETTLNNYLSDIHKLQADSRGELEFPRELPGFLTALFAGWLLFLRESRVGAVAAIAMAAGLLGISLIEITYWHMLAWLFIWSAGQHLMMPVQTSLAIELSEPGRSGTRLGQAGFVTTLGMLVGAFCVWQVFGRLHISNAEKYRIAFIVAAFMAILAALVLFKMPATRHGSYTSTRFIIRRRYTLFYILCVLFGARKQIFITFAPWVLVKVFHQPFTVIGKLFFVAALLGLITKPAMGWLIDRLGERFILFMDGLVLLAICIGYGFAEVLFDRSTALLVLESCFVIDNIMFAVGMARHTYVSKIADEPGDITATFSLGITINHAVSMTAPVAGGYLWMVAGYGRVFDVAACIAVMSAFVALWIRIPAPGQAEHAQDA